MSKILNILNKIDQFLLTNTAVFSNFVLTWINTSHYLLKIFEILSTIKKDFVILLEKLSIWHCNNFPDFCKLCADLNIVYQANKIFIWFSLRRYVYILLVIYVVTYIFIVIAFVTDIPILLRFAEILYGVYKLWSYPISNFRFLIKYIFTVPFNIVQTILMLLCQIIRFFT